MRALAAAGAALALVACGVTDSSQLKACEEQLLEKLKSPSSYKRISTDEMTLNAGKPPHYYSVSIEYDAANSYGALLRDTERCSFRLDEKGRATTEMFEPYAGLTDPTTELLTSADEPATTEETSPAEESVAAVDDEPMHDIHPEGAAIVADAVRANQQYPGNCYKDYCPCEDPQEGMDSMLCDQLEEGLDVPIEHMIAGRGGREVRRQLDELGY